MKLLLVLLLVGCSTAPVTGRKQIKLLPESTMRSQASSAYRDILRKAHVDRSSSKARTLKRIGRRIQAAVEAYFRSQGEPEVVKGYNWEFSLIKSKELNAWAMPGGKVAFYTGILDVCQNDAGIAVVMGHEIAHAIAGHGNENVSRGLLAQGVLLGADMSLKKKNKITRQAVLAAAGVGAFLILN